MPNRQDMNREKPRLLSSGRMKLFIITKHYLTYFLSHEWRTRTFNPCDTHSPPLEQIRPQMSSIAWGSSLE